METDKYVFFYGHKPNKTGVHVFSQWYPAKFTEKINENTTMEYQNAEQYMMAHKALLFGDGYYYEKIMESNDPLSIKKYGRKICDFDPEIWDKHKFDIVTEGNRLKFGQNPTLMKRLLETGNKTIVEAAHYDKVWGIGLRAEDAIKISEDKWPGQNLLGKALMVVRKENK
ncbi:hypothetical protein QJ857_gp1347 [Tupanvirus soda lake]|uniref:NADAR domain-containing protein n=2 Tax=Tupanvirus TaxID=2094720 RepID=A0A6N1NIE8_9VIRU|nr:hypothetical protein QJ857_gp1347 [Tupanvirus soda lake]QKU34715.1 hypothetical protein [Tupanvirus soda lake]